MKKIIICFLLMCSVGLWANPAEKDSLKNDSARIESVQTENILNTDNAYSTINDIDAIADKVVEKMKQENKEKMAIMTKKIVITTGEIIIGILIFILGAIVGLLYNKVFKKLQEMRRKPEEESQSIKHRLTSIEKNVVETAKNVEKIKGVVASNTKQIVTQPTEQENNVKDVKENSYESIKNEPKTIYAKPLGNGNLKAITEALEAIYIISIDKDNTGKFSLYENEDQKKRAIKNKDNMLDLFCDAKGSSIGAESIRVLSEGEVELFGNDIWRVIKKAEIEFIR